MPNFTLEQVQELIGQYTDEVGQPFAPEVIKAIHKQTAGQPVLVNRLAQILTEEMCIPETQTITIAHFLQAHTQLLRGRNTNIEHLTTNIRKDIRFERVLMRIIAHEDGVDFNLHDEIIDELATYGVISEGADGLCEIANPIYLYAILQAFKPTVNGLEAVLSRRHRRRFFGLIVSEKATEGYYVVFDHWQTPKPRVETETLDGVTIRSYVIPVMQEMPSNTLHRKT